MKVAVALAEPEVMALEDVRPEPAAPVLDDRVILADRAVVSPPRRVVLGPADRIPVGEGRRFWVDGREIAVYRDRRRQFYATQNWCPHHFGSLADGNVGYSEVSCPLHGLRFDLRTGAPKGHDCGRLRTYRVRLTRRGELELILPDAFPVTSDE